MGNNPIVEINAKGLTVRLAESDAEIDAAQALRYRVFYEEMDARPTDEMRARNRDFDDFDPVADHLLVVKDDEKDPKDAVVATYRLIRREAAREAGRFYTSDEYDITNLLNYPGAILELGRSCIDASVRDRRTMKMLWTGLGAYIFHHDIEIMFGCASLPGTEPQKLAVPLSFLYHNHLAPPALRTRAVEGRFVDMNMVPPGDLATAESYATLPQDLAELPPLIKGYLRVGAFVGDGAVVDYQFNTTDVCVIVKTDLMSQQYSKKFVKKE